MRYHGATVESVDELIASLQTLRAKLMREGIHDAPGYVPPRIRDQAAQRPRKPPSEAPAKRMRPTA